MTRGLLTKHRHLGRPRPVPGLDLVVDALATHRITHLITEDTIPFGKARDHVLQRWPDSLAAEWVTCPWCMSVTVAAGVVTARELGARWWPAVAMLLAFSSVTGLLATWEHRNP